MSEDSSEKSSSFLETHRRETTVAESENLIKPGIEKKKLKLLKFNPMVTSSVDQKDEKDEDDEIDLSSIDCDSLSSGELGCHRKPDAMTSIEQESTESSDEEVSNDEQKNREIQKDKK